METTSNGRQNGRTLSIPSGQVNTLEWQKLLWDAIHPDLDVLVSNYREHDISCEDADIPSETPPGSTTGRLLAVLYKRFLHFNGRPGEELIVINNELSDRELLQLGSVVLELAHLNNLDPLFIDWLESNVSFSSTVSSPEVG